jgi:hypothetical protein
MTDPEPEPQRGWWQRPFARRLPALFATWESVGATAVLGAIVAMCAVGAYWILEPATIVTEPTKPYATRDYSPGVKPQRYEGPWWPGEELLIYRELCVKKLARGTVLRALVDTSVVQLPSIPASAELTQTGCYGRTYAITLPPRLTPRLYQYAATLELELNRLRTVTLPLEKVPIAVVEEPPSTTVRAVEQSRREIAQMVAMQKKTQEMLTDLARVQAFSMVTNDVLKKLSDTMRSMAEAQQRQTEALERLERRGR